MRALLLGAAVAGVLGPMHSARGDLRPEQVLVVYDSRISDSKLVAEYYAGSAKVPGGVGGQAGKRPLVKVFDLASSGASVFNGTDMPRTSFVTQMRVPIRNWLTSNDAGGAIRCLVMTKGLPHRVIQANGSNVGDNPSLADSANTAGNYNSASVDSELTLLWIDLEQGEANGRADSRADGLVINPYWKQSLPIQAWRTTNRRAVKTLTTPTTSPSSGAGELWNGNVTSASAAPAPSNLTPGDIYLVCRLDGNTVADVRSIIDRAAGPAIVMNVDTAGFVLDESDSDGVQSPMNTGPLEFDNAGYNIIWGGDDFEQSRDYLVGDGRFLASKVKYDPTANAANFIVGSRVSYGGQGLIIDTPANPLPLLLLAHYGANHDGTAPGEVPQTNTFCRQTYATSFTYAPGAVFNTIESYNGRAFGGIGQNPSVQQQQAADYLAAGGTFAIGNVFEPFAHTVADNNFIVRNFLLGNLSWGEAAYTALPGLSFQQIVIGDPLARAARTSEDRDGDGVITVEDLYRWNAAPADLSRNGVINDVDRRYVEDAVRFTRDTDMRGTQR